MHIEGTCFQCAGYNVRLHCAQYGNGRLAIQAICDDGEPYGNLTVNLPNEELGEGELFIKTWGGNEELTACALATGLFIDTDRPIVTGWTTAETWKLVKGVEI